MKPSHALTIVTMIVLFGSAIAELVATHKNIIITIGVIAFSCLLIYTIRTSHKNGNQY